jgi:hypothetical protein
LTLEQYFGRERHLGGRELTSNGRIKYWVLVPRSNPEEIIASCETIEKKALTGTKTLTAHAIASVFTNPKYRRQGMAALMLQGLQSWFDGEGESDLSVLYSDIGAVSSSYQ